MSDDGPKAAAPAVGRIWGRLHAAALAAAIAGTLLAGTDAWAVRFAAAPPLAALPWIAAYALVLLRSGRADAGVGRDVLLALLCVGAAASVRAAALGDRLIWLSFPHLPDPKVHLSEGLGGALQLLAFRIGGVEGQRNLAPLWGGLATFAWLRALRSLLGPLAASPAAGRAAAGAWIATPLPLVFAFDYVENTQAALAPMLAALPALVRASDVAASPDRRRRDAGVAGAWFGLAAATHGFALFVAPAAPLAALFGRGPGRLRAAATSLATTGAAFGAVFAALAACGLGPTLGHAAGGDGQLFVPWTLDGAPPSARFPFFDAAHFREAAQVILCSAPLAATTLPLLLRRGSAAPALALAALGAVGFATLVNFDLAFPQDADLMLGLGVVAQAGAALLAARRAAEGRSGRLEAVLALAAAAAIGWPLAGGLLDARAVVPMQRNAPDAKLTIDGRDDASALGPVRVPVDSAAPRALIRIHGSPHGVATLLVGPESPFPVRLRAFGKLDLDGYLHVGRGAAYEEDWITRIPCPLDAHGDFSYAWSGPLREPTAVQALLTPPPGTPGRARLTAAFVLEPR